MKKPVLLIFILIMAALVLHAQQNPLYTQYMFNHLVINPAYAGTKPYMSLTGIVRKQWAGFEGSPLTASVSIHGPAKNKKMGFGFLINNDHIGIVDQTDFYGSYAYQVPLATGKLSMGLSAGFSLYSSKFSDLLYFDSGDPVYTSNTLNTVLPNFGGGVFYYAEKFYTGLSAPQLLSYDSNDKLSIKKENVYHPTPHFYWTAGYVIETKGLTKIKPSALIRYVRGSDVSFDINCNILISDILWLGASYRHQDAVAAIVEYQLTRKLRFGYSYDYTLSDFKNYAGNTHEVMLSFEFGYDIMKIKSPRYF